MLKIISKQEGFRRCGMAHGCAEAQYEDGFFSDEQLEQLRKEPMLVVSMPAGSVVGGTADEQKRLNAAETIAVVKALVTPEELDAMLLGEERKSVIAAIAARREELAEAAGRSSSIPGVSGTQPSLVSE